METLPNVQTFVVEPEAVRMWESKPREWISDRVEPIHAIFIGGSSELPMWLTDGFSVTFFGRWWGAVHIHVSHVQLPTR